MNVNLDHEELIVSSQILMMKIIITVVHIH